MKTSKLVEPAEMNGKGNTQKKKTTYQKILTHFWNNLTILNYSAKINSNICVRSSTDRALVFQARCWGKRWRARKQRWSKSALLWARRAWFIPRASQVRTESGVADESREGLEPINKFFCVRSSTDRALVFGLFALTITNLENVCIYKHFSKYKN